MDAAVRNFLAAVDRYLRGAENSDHAAPALPHSQQLQLLRKQLHQLFGRYPLLRPLPDPTEEVYEETEDVAPGGSSAGSSGADAEPRNASAGMSHAPLSILSVPVGRNEAADGLRDTPGGSDSSAIKRTETGGRTDAGSSGGSSGDGKGNGIIVEEFYDDTGPVDVIEQETYDEVGTPSVQEEYDEIGAAQQSYIPMFRPDAPKPTPLRKLDNGGQAHVSAPSTVGPPPDTPAPPLPPLAPTSAAAVASASASIAGSVADLSEATSVSSLISAAGSEESTSREPQPAAQFRSIASRWGRLELRQSSRLRPWRRFWGGLVDTKLNLYQKETDPTHRLSVSLAGYEVRVPPPAVELKDKQRPLCFELVKPGGKTYTMLGLTPKDARQWMAALERAAASATPAPPAVKNGVQDEEVTSVVGDAGGCCRQPAGRPPAPPPSTEASSSVLPTKPAAAEPASDSSIEELLYNVPADEELIYDDITFSNAQTRDSVDDTYVQEDIYEAIGSPRADEPPGLPPSFAVESGRSGGSSAPKTLLLAPSNADAPGRPPKPPERDPVPRSPRPPMRLPPVEPPAVPVIPPPPTRTPPPPPVVETIPQRTPTIPCRPQPALPAVPPPPRPPPSTAGSSQPEIVEELYDEMMEPMQEEMYDEMAPVSALSPQTDPFYNVLEPESEYRQPPHASPLPLPTVLSNDDPSDEGYGNSSAGSEAECRSVGESHYKTPPFMKPIPLTKTRAISDVRDVSSASELPKDGQLKANTLATSSAKENAGGTSAVGESKFTKSETLPSKSKETDIAKKGTSASIRKPLALNIGSTSASGGSVRDVIARLNRQSVGDEGSDASSPHVVTISAELAQKQALIAGAVGRIASPTSAVSSPASSAKSSNAATKKPLAKPAVTAPKPFTLSSRFKKSSVGGSEDIGYQQKMPVSTARSETQDSGAKASAPPSSPLTPNKSGVYSAMRRSLGRQQDLTLKVHTPTEEEEVYAEIDDLPGTEWRV